jgi:LmbE family N-acetylglucosaminyl deacetylase
VIDHPFGATKRLALRRVLTLALLIPLFSLLLFCGSHAYVIYAHNRAADEITFPIVYSPHAGQSRLIVSPHPDDETLGTSGLIQQALRAGVPVHIIFLTDGDAFRVGAARYYDEIHVRSSDFVKYGEMRESEARAANGSIGLPASDITFLGYPDAGMLPIWRSHWYAAHPFTSRYTGASSVPYPDAYHYGSAYCGQNVTSDLASLIGSIHPTDLYVTHPSDDHPDHSAAPAFVGAAIARLARTGQTWASGIRVHYYIVHRGDWPVPQGLVPHESLAPPAPMISLDTRWHSLPLTALQTQGKLGALRHYASQQEMMRRFLVSFVRTNEIFGQIPGQNALIPEVAPSQIVLDGNSGDWPMMQPLLIDPVGDTVLRDFQSSADLRGVYVCTDDRNLYVRVDCETELSPQIQYTIFLRAFGVNGESPASGLTVTYTPVASEAGQQVPLKGGVMASYNQSTYEVAIPLSQLGVRSPQQIYLEVESSFGAVTVDRTGIRCGILSPPPVGHSLS